MPDDTNYRRDERPTEGFRTAFLPVLPQCPVRYFVPADYQPKYAYPLVVLFHPDGCDEDTAATVVPNLSRRNYIMACPRGPQRRGRSTTGRPGFGWDRTDYLNSYYLQAVLTHAQAKYHVHPERVYLLGVGEGAAIAFQLGFALPDIIAGVIALNGRLPNLRTSPDGGPGMSSRLRVFIGHGLANPIAPLALARRAARQAREAGADVRFTTYRTTHRLHDDMLRDVNRWIMEAVNEAEGLPLAMG
jgi:phospholipase/carboxylesterase